MDQDPHLRSHNSEMQQWDAMLHMIYACPTVIQSVEYLGSPCTRLPFKSLKKLLTKKTDKFIARRHIQWIDISKTWHLNFRWNVPLSLILNTPTQYSSVQSGDYNIKWLTMPNIMKLMDDTKKDNKCDIQIMHTFCKKTETLTGFWSFVYCFLITSGRWHGLCWLQSCSCHTTCRTSVQSWWNCSLHLNIIPYHLRASSSSSSSSSSRCFFTSMLLWLCWRHCLALTTAEVSVHLLDDPFLWLCKKQISYVTSYWILWTTRPIHRWLVYILAASTTYCSAIAYMVG